jgi:N-acyl-D-amino-acid deacylase
MTLPWVATGSDGGPHVPDRATCPHPRSYGTFPRKIGLYALREKTIPMAQAIRSATGLPSDILKLTDRGYLRSGYVADLVVFDPKTFIDRATFEQPHQYADGVRYVFLAGHTAIDDGTPSQQLFGRAIRHQKSKQARE